MLQRSQQNTERIGTNSINSLVQRGNHNIQGEWLRNCTRLLETFQTQTSHPSSSSCGPFVAAIRSVPAGGGWKREGRAREEGLGSKIICPFVSLEQSTGLAAWCSRETGQGEGESFALTLELRSCSAVARNQRQTHGTRLHIDRIFSCPSASDLTSPSSMFCPPS